MADSMIRCCADIVKSLSLAHDEGNDVSLNVVRAKSAKKFKLKQMPRLVDIIAAVPPELADALIPKLKAKPVRTASGVRSTAQSFLYSGVTADCSCCRHVQAPQMPTHCHDRQYLRVRGALSHLAALKLRQDTALVARTATSSTLPSPIQATNLPACVRSGRDTIRTSKVEGEWSSFEAWGTPSIR
jgi:hypothetical protein